MQFIHGEVMKRDKSMSCFFAFAWFFIPFFEQQWGVTLKRPFGDRDQSRRSYAEVNPITCVKKKGQNIRPGANAIQ